MPVTTLRRASVTAAAATFAGLGALAVAPAHAVSAELTYTCSAFTVSEEIDPEGLPEAAREAIERAQEGDLSGLEDLQGLEGLEDLPIEEIEDLVVTAVFDSAIANGATTTPGSTVALSPLTTTITLAPETVAALTDIDLATAEAGAVLYSGIEETGAEREAYFEFEDVSVTGGRAELKGTGDAEAFKANAPGTFTYAGGDLDVFIGDPQGPFTVLECTLDEGQDATIDVITAKAAPTTPPTTPPTGPVRPDVVQTDAAQPTSPTWLPLAATGVGSVLVLGAASRLTRRSAHRD